MKRTLFFWLMLLPFMWLSAQTGTITVSGNVTDQSGQALANYAFVGGTFGPVFNAVQTSTDANGAYSVSLQVDTAAGSLVFIAYNDCIDPNAIATVGNLTANTTYNFTACAGGSPFCDAAFNPIPQSPTSLTVDFQAFVSGYSSYDWFFGDGNTNFGSSSSVTHTYAAAGTYSTLLAVIDNTTGCNDTFAIQIQVPNGGNLGCDAHFTPLPNGPSTIAFLPVTVDPNLSYSWDFGDGNTSTSPTPSHTYAATSGTYNVCLVVTDPTLACQDSFCSTVTLGTNTPCAINFFAQLAHASPLQATFYPSDTSFSSYAWDFGDGNTSTAVNPAHTYAAIGTYNICLTVSDGANCTVTWCDSIRIDTLPQGACDATFGYNTGFWPLTVDFSILNQGPAGFVVSNWDFGDGNTAQGSGFISHTYAVPDTYNVCATVFDITLGCADLFCQTVIVTNQGGQNCSAYFYSSHDPVNPNTIGFLPIGANYANYNWDFGDGNTSTQSAPSHNYSQSGTYNVCLTVDDGAGCVDSFCTQILVGLFSPCIADFTAIPDTSGTTVTFSALFPDPNITYTWDFGDGSTGSGSSVTYTYASSGTYNVTLNITDGASCSSMQTQTISTVPNPPSQNLLFGQVLVNGIPATDITAYLIQYDSVAGTLTAIDTFSSNGMLGFSGLFYFEAPAGDFLVKASLNTSDPDFSNYLPTYYGDSLSWTGATMVNAAVFPLVLINLQPGANTGGPGFIGGLISQGAGKNGPGDPMEGMSVMVMDANGTPVTHTLSHEDGTFELAGLAYGTYTVIVDFWGKTSQTHTITLSEANPRMENADFNVNENFIEAVSPATSIGGVIEMNSVSLYPNPANQKTTLELRLLESQELTLTVSDLSGKQIHSLHVKAATGNQRIEVKTNDLPEGLYLLNIRSGNEFLITQKLMINRQ